MPIVGKQLQTLRERQRLTQEELASRAGISPRAVQKYENLEGDPSLDVLVKLADALQTTMDFLAGRINDPNPYVERVSELTAFERFFLTMLRRGKLPPGFDPSSFE